MWKSSLLFLNIEDVSVFVNRENNSSLLGTKRYNKESIRQESRVLRYVNCVTSNVTRQFTVDKALCKSK